MQTRQKENVEGGITSFDNTSEQGNFDTSRKINFSDRTVTKWKTILDEMSVFP